CPRPDPNDPEFGYGSAALMTGGDSPRPQEEAGEREPPLLAASTYLFQVYSTSFIPRLTKSNCGFANCIFDPACWAAAIALCFASNLREDPQNPDDLGRLHAYKYMEVYCSAGKIIKGAETNCTRGA